MKQTREAWIDTAKGIAILCVVIGHSDLNSDIINIIFWFHMPAFFIIAGYLFRPKKNYLQDRAYRLLIPYLVFSIFIFILNIVLGNPPSLMALVVGGRALDDSYPLFAPFWFITCLFVTQVTFNNLLRFKKASQITIIFLFFLLAHLESHFLPNINSYLFAHTHLHLLIPWDADVALIALSYYSIGFFSRQIYNTLQANLTTICLIFFMTILSLNFFGIIDYLLDMKYVVYNNLLLDILIPVSITLILFRVSQFLKGITLLNIMGNNTIIIMYLHLPIMVVASLYIQNVILLIILAIALPLVIAAMLRKSNILSIVFLGDR